MCGAATAGKGGGGRWSKHKRGGMLLSHGNKTCLAGTSRGGREGGGGGANWKRRVTTIGDWWAGSHARRSGKWHCYMVKIEPHVEEYDLGDRGWEEVGMLDAGDAWVGERVGGQPPGHRAQRRIAGVSQHRIRIGTGYVGRYQACMVPSMHGGLGMCR